MDYTGPKQAPKETIFRFNPDTNSYAEITLQDAIDAQDQSVIALIRTLITLLEAALDFANATLDKLSQVHRVDLNREVPFELILRKRDLDRRLKAIRDQLTQPAPTSTPTPVPEADK